MRVIAVPIDDEDDILAEDHARLSSWAPSNGWTYLEYHDCDHLLTRIGSLNADTIRELEIVAHGSPNRCNDIDFDNVEPFGKSLHKLPGMSGTTTIYLSGCNTGLEFREFCIARSLGIAFRGTVFGARGYLEGTHAEQTDRCFATFEEDGVVYESYPGAIDATGEDAWIPFGTRLYLADRPIMHIKIAVSGYRPVNLPQQEGEKFVAMIEKIVRTPPSAPARLRLAPDLKFTILLSDGERILEFLAAGSVLRDPIKNQVWQCEGGPEMLQRLMPFQIIPPAG